MGMEMPEGQSLADRLKQALSDKGWSENELARRSGVPQPTIHRIITGESQSPRTGNLTKLSDALGLSVVQLTYGDPEGSRYGANGNSRSDVDNNVSEPMPLTQYYRYPV